MSEKHIKTSSVLAFLWLPQFRFSFEGFAHVYPIFIRVLAMMFGQAGLVPANHPATRYGIKGVEKYGFRALMGDAWFTLRTTRATTYQWGMFGALVMMITLLVSAIGTFILNVFFGLGALAHAQIFTHPGTPYGNGNASSMTEVGALTPGNNLIYDARVGDGCTGGLCSSNDYALMVLDKVLRQAAAGTNTGGALQKGLGAILQVYNTGVLVVAGVILFWMIVSIVLDTAKTGTIGGGRHNMVWAPIRVVFALGIMIPLGSVGFSSGQYMVMKLAEWGSNFASTGWNAYVTNVVDGQQLLTPYSMPNLVGLASDINKIMVCQIAYNTHVMQSTGNLGLRVKANIGSSQYGNETVQSYTVPGILGVALPNLCGTISYSKNFIGPTTDYTHMVMMGALSAVAPGAAIIGAAVSWMTNDPLTGATENFRVTMLGALQDGLRDDGTEGSIIAKSRDFACAFVGHLNAAKAGANPADNPVFILPECANRSQTACNTSNDPNNGHGPDASCLTNDTSGSTGTSASGSPVGGNGTGSLDLIIQQINNRFTSADAGLQNYVQGTGPNTLLGKMRERGWGGMGIWNHEITVLNRIISSAREDAASINPGTLWSINCEDSAAQKTGDCNPSGLEGDVYTAMQEYSKWWDGIATDAAAAPVTSAQTTAALKTKYISTSVKSVTKGSIKKAEGTNSGDNMSFVNSFIKQFVPQGSEGYFIFDTIDLTSRNTYPLAQLMHAGTSIMNFGLGLMGGVFLAQVVSTLSLWGFSAGGGFSVGSLPSMVHTIGMTLTIAGMMLSFYLPALPFIKVALAVLTWIISVFEAVIMVPIAGLAHLTSEGEGLAGGARTCWILWLNVLMRPILVVFGFIGGMLILNAFIVFWNVTFTEGAKALAASQSPIGSFLAQFAYTIIYFSVMYTAANTTFKLLDLIPNALMRWMGGSPDQTFDHDQTGEMMMAGSNMMRQMTPSSYSNMRFGKQKDKQGELLQKIEQNTRK